MHELLMASQKSNQRTVDYMPKFFIENFRKKIFFIKMTKFY